MEVRTFSRLFSLNLRFCFPHVHNVGSPGVGWRLRGCTDWLHMLHWYTVWALMTSKPSSVWMRKRWYFPNKENLFFQSQMDESKPLEEIRTWEHPPWYGIDHFKEIVILTNRRTRRVSSTTSRLTSGCRWSNKRLLVHVGKLHLPPPRWTKSQILLAERRILLYSTVIHWRNQNYSHEFGCQAREAH